MSDVGKLGFTERRLMAFACGPTFVSIVNFDMTPDFTSLETRLLIAASDRLTAFAISTKGRRLSSLSIERSFSSV